MRKSSIDLSRHLCLACCLPQVMVFEHLQLSRTVTTIRLPLELLVQKNAQSEYGHDHVLGNRFVLEKGIDFREVPLS